MNQPNDKATDNAATSGPTDYPDLPSLKTRRQWWAKGVKRTLWIKLLCIGAVALAAYMNGRLLIGELSGLPSWLPLALPAASVVLIGLPLAIMVIRDYPTQWHVEFDQRIRRAQGGNDRVADD